MDSPEGDDAIQTPLYVTCGYLGLSDFENTTCFMPLSVFHLNWLMSCNSIRRSSQRNEGQGNERVFTTLESCSCSRRSMMK